jgi:hypothetical protein
VTPVKVVGDKLQYHLGYAPRLMDVERAAAYVGFGPTKFRELVVERKMPEPVDVDGLPRWDRYQLDAAVDDLRDAAAIRSDAARIGWSRN